MKQILSITLSIILASSFAISQTIGIGMADEGLKEAKSMNGILAPSQSKKTLIERNDKRIPDAQVEYLNQKNSIDKISPGLKSTSVVEDVAFMRPAGFFRPGHSVDYSYYTFYFLFGPAYEMAVWRNFTTAANNYSWTLPDPDGTDVTETGDITTTLNSSLANPPFNYPFASYYSNPSLTGSDGAASQTFTWGGEDSVYIFTGGSADGIFGLGACNFDNHFGMFAYISETEDNYWFGTTTDNSVDAVVNYFEKPSKRYVVDSIWINATYCTAPAGTEFAMIIHRLDDEGDPVDTIATSTITIEDIQGPYGDGDYFYSLVYSSFDVFDPDLGFEISQDYLEIEDAIMIEITGFNNKTGVDFCVMAQEFDTSPVDENNAYIYFFDTEGERVLGRYTNVNSSLAFNMNVIYSFLLSDDNSFIAPEDGGAKTFELNSYYSPEAYWLTEDLPDWLTMDFTFDEETFDITMTLTATALPEGVTGRSHTLNLFTYGSDLSIGISQGDVTAIDVREISETKVISVNGIIELVYDKAYTNAKIFTLSGQMVDERALPATGKLSFRPEIAKKGMYIISLSGENGIAETVKFVY